MSELQDKIANELDTFRTVANARSRGGDDPMDVAWEFVPRFTALIAEAMLSEEVYAEMDRARFEGTVWNNDETMIVEGEEGSNQAVITAALTAAGITGAGQEGGEGEWNQ